MLDKNNDTTKIDPYRRPSHVSDTLEKTWGHCLLKQTHSSEVDSDLFCDILEPHPESLRDGTIMKSLFTGRFTPEQGNQDIFVWISQFSSSMRNFFPSTVAARERVVRVRLVSVSSSRRFRKKLGDVVY